MYDCALLPSEVERMKEWDGHCHRCQKKSGSYSMSYFNTQLICPDCQKTEAKDPNFEKAKEYEAKQVQQGNWNFEGLYGKQW